MSGKQVEESFKDKKHPATGRVDYGSGQKLARDWQLKLTVDQPRWPRASFTRLCGAAPIPVSSGRAGRHRLHRDGTVRPAAPWGASPWLAWITGGCGVRPP